jgi:hypothetical protein
VLGGDTERSAILLQKKVDLAGERLGSSKLDQPGIQFTQRQFALLPMPLFAVADLFRKRRQ